MVDVTRAVIRLGNFTDGIADIDTDGVGLAENAGALVGQTYTGATMSIETITYSDGNTDGFVNFDGTVGPGGDYITFDLGSGAVSESVDQAVWYNVDVLLGNGSTLSTNALVFQTPGGETFLTEFSLNSLDNLDIQSITLTGVNNNAFPRMSTENSVNNTTVCFARGTAILTPDGPWPVDDFRPGDPVLTTDGCALPVRAVYQATPKAPGSREAVRFAAGSLCPGSPETPLVVTANHRMFCASRLVERMFGCSGVLIPAKRLVGLHGIDLVEHPTGIKFFHLELMTHSVICANGALTESCLLGLVALKALPPLLRISQAVEPPQATRYPVPKGHIQKQFVRRLAENGHTLIEGPVFRCLRSRLDNNVALHVRPADAPNTRNGLRMLRLSA